jgi:hypothetical protein
MRAKFLLAKLREKQTHSDGRVWYGHAVTYERIASWFGEDGPSPRTLERWMAELRRGGAVNIRYARMRQGMRLQLALGAARAFRHAQMSMFSEPVEMPRKPVEKRGVSVEKLSFPQTDVSASLRAACPQICGQKDLSLNRHVKRLEPPLADARGQSLPDEQIPKANGSGATSGERRIVGELDRPPWNDADRMNLLTEFYALRKYLGKMPRARDPAKWDALHARWNELEDIFDGKGIVETARAENTG